MLFGFKKNSIMQSSVEIKKRDHMILLYANSPCKQMTRVIIARLSIIFCR